MNKLLRYAVVAGLSFGAGEVLTVNPKYHYEQGFEAAKQQTMTILRAESDSAYKQRTEAGSRIFTSSPGVWPQIKGIRIGDEEYHCNYNYDYPDSLETYVVNYEVARNIGNKVDKIRGEIGRLNSP